MKGPKASCEVESRGPRGGHGRLGLAVWVSLLVSGCVLEPFQGQQVADIEAPIRLSGFVPEPLSVFRNIEVSALSGTTGSFESLASEVVIDRNLLTSAYFGEQWSAWETQVQLSSEHWLPGDAGFRAVLQATAGGSPATFFGEGLADCAPRFIESSLAEMLDGCGFPGQPVTVCTADYVHPGARRGPCPSRLLDINPASADLRRMYPADRTETFALNDSPGTFSLRGDSASFVDIFDSPVGGLAPGAYSAGVSRGSFVRLFYSQQKSSRELQEFDWGAIRSGVPSGLSLGLPQTLRFYDRGECSARVSLEQLLPSVESVLLGALEPLMTAGSGQVERATLVPVLRTGSDAIAARLRLAIVVPSPSPVAGMHRVTVSVQAGLSAVAEDLEFEREHFSVAVPAGVDAADLFEGLGLGGPIEAEAAFEDAFWSQGAAALQEALGDLPVSALPLQRVFLTPEGLELVLVDDPENPTREALLATEPQLCAREPSAAGVEYGSFEALVRQGAAAAGG